MVIGVDIDGVLTNVEAWQFRVGGEYTKKPVVDETAFDVKGIFGLTDEEYKDFLDDCLTDYAENEPCRENAADVLHKLQDEGNRIVIVTGRFHASEDTEEGAKQRGIVFKWLKRAGIEPDNVIFTSPTDNKKDILLNNNISLMIEDKASTITSLSSIMDVICFDAKYNQDCNGENIHRVYNWNDIYTVVNALSDKEKGTAKTIAQ